MLIRSARRLFKLADFSPFVKPELRFDNFPRHAGGGRTLAALVGTNVGVWAAWQYAHEDATNGDEGMLDFMEEHFTSSNIGMSEPHNLHKVVTSSFSHQDLGHLVGNMTALLMLGPRLHEFLGRSRFMFLYLMGCVGGTLATQALHLDPFWEANQVALTPCRYTNILQSCDPGKAVGLGASDAISALFACFYFIFPRQPVPFLFLKSNVAWKMMPKSISASVPIVGNLFRRSKAPAIWVLPMFFFVDFATVWRLLTNDNSIDTGLRPTSNTGHAAHVGGFLAGSTFYGAVAHALKATYFKFTLQERTRTAYLMTLSLGFWYLVTRTLHASQVSQGDKDETKVLLLMTYSPDDEEKKNNTKVEDQLRELWQARPKLPDLVQRANSCSLLESCTKDLVDGRCGACDSEFAAVRDMVKANTSAPRAMIASLQPQIFDSLACCRTVLREHGHQENLGQKIHGQYYKEPPTICEIQLSLLPVRSWSFFSFIPQPTISLDRTGLVLEEKKSAGEVRLTRVVSGSQAQAAGADALIGNAVTHVCHKPVGSIEEMRRACSGQRVVSIWFEWRRTRDKDGAVVPGSETQTGSSGVRVPDRQQPDSNVLRAASLVSVNEVQLIAGNNRFT